MPKGEVRVQTLRASLDALPHQPGAVRCVVEVPHSTRAETAPARMEDSCGEWEHEQLSLQTLPDSNSVGVHVYDDHNGRGDLLASGTYSLRHLFEADEEVAEVPVADPATHKHAGSVRLALRFFRKRSPGKERDTLGREVVVVNRADGHRQAAVHQWPHKVALPVRTVH